MDNKWGYIELKRERSTMGSLIDEAVFEWFHYWPFNSVWWKDNACNKW